MTGREPISLVEKFYSMDQDPDQDPRICWQDFTAVVRSLDMVFEQPILVIVMYVLILDALDRENDFQNKTTWIRRPSK